MLLSEAKELLRNNGYKLVEATAKLSDDTYEVDLDDGKAEVGNFRKQLVKDLNAAGLKSNLYNGGWELWIKDYDENYHAVLDDSTEGLVKVILYKKFAPNRASREKWLGSKEFDIRTTRGMVEWIIDIIENNG